MRTRPSLVLSTTRAVYAACVALCTFACTQAQPTDQLGEKACRELLKVDAPDRPNIVIVVNDTMRRDYLGLYGGPAATPHLDNFARDHFHFQNAFSQAPWTKPSIATLFTSLYPSQHHVASDPALRELRDRDGAGGVAPADALPQDYETLAEVARNAGYRTAAFVSNPWMGARFGFDQGFDVYDDSFASWACDGDAVIETTLAWVESLPADTPYFIYVHLLDSHRPYGAVSLSGLADKRKAFNDDTTPMGGDAEVLAHVIQIEDGRSAAAAGFEATRSLVRDAYRAGIEAFDGHFQRLASALAEHPRWPQTAMIVTSDHGEALYDRGYGNHGGGLYDDETAIPLLARLPGVEGRQASVSCLTGLVDLMPTICTYLDIECPEDAVGWSFLAEADRSETGERRFLVSEGVMNHVEHRSVRNLHHKLVYEPDGPRDGREKTSAWSLYDLAGDPAEHIDRTELAEPGEATWETLGTMIQAMSEATAAMADRRTAVISLDPVTAARLSAIGYGE